VRYPLERGLPQTPLWPALHGVRIGLMGAKARKDGEMVEAGEDLPCGAHGPRPRWPELATTRGALSELPDVMEELLVEHFGARRSLAGG